METKSVKIPKAIHKEVAIWCANNDDEGISEFISLAIVGRLSEVGHKWKLANAKDADRFWRDGIILHAKSKPKSSNSNTKGK